MELFKCPDIGLIHMRKNYSESRARTLGNSFRLPVPQLPHLETENVNIMLILFTRLLRGMELIYVKLLRGMSGT